MASMREIKSRIAATKKTSQITKAMYMVSASKLKKAEKAIKGFRPLMHHLKNMIYNIIDDDDLVSHPMMIDRQASKICYILVSSDRGLAGPYNSSVFKAFSAHVARYHISNDEFVVAPIGFKAFSYAKRMNFELLNNKPINVRDDIQFIDFEGITKMFQRDYLDEKIDSIIVFYNQFINTITQKVKYTQIIPIVNNQDQDKEKEEKDKDNGKMKLIYNYEPSPQAIIDHLIPLYVENTLYGLILEAKASEHASRMTAMKSATDNAEEVIETLQLHYNRARQAAITIELTDIIGGANAVN